MKNDFSVIGSLLQTISWEGRYVNAYRNGGKGLENVLTAEVFQILDFLPRKHFFGEIIKSFHMNESNIKGILLREIEDSEFTLLPSNYYLKDPYVSHQKSMAVQPDGIFETPSVYTLLEAKRIKKSSFQKQQLAKEFYLVTKNHKKKIPLLLLVLGKEPPVSIDKSGRKELKEGILFNLPEIYDLAASHVIPLDELESMVEKHVAWITWFEIRDIVIKQLSNYRTNNSSDRRSIERLCNTLIKAINRHS